VNRRTKYLLLFAAFFAALNYPWVRSLARGDAQSGWQFIIVVNLVTAALAWVILTSERYGGRRRTPSEPLRIEALRDLLPADGPAAISDVDDDVVDVVGPVVSADEHEVVIDLGDRLVVVILDGHATPPSGHLRALGRVLGA